MATQKTRQSAVKKTTVTLPAGLLKDLQETAIERGTTVSEILRCAAEVDRILRAAAKDGEKILLKAADESLREIVIVR
jgi:hypothetical protein